MKILTLNINSIRAHIESFMDILRKNEYDTILVQELKVENANFPHNLFDAYGYNIKVFGQKSWNGVATFSKYSIEDITMGMPTYPDINSRFLETVIDGRVRLINVYMPNGDCIESPKFPYKLEWMRAFTDYISQYIDSEEPVIIAGDFNVAIEDRDIWNPKNYVGSSISAPAARDIMQEWLDTGWVDAWRAQHPDTIDYTWYGYRGRDTVGNKQGLRLDYFLCNKTAIKMVKNCEIDKDPRLADKPTDHCGLMLEIKD
ncbi:MAG: exodeoxyribonuclease III [Alphaproteobacteria bacterium]|nr:exodeoxyribonuclease III [Alphaproteobacteria bacterium]